MSSGVHVRVRVACMSCSLLPACGPVSVLLPPPGSDIVRFGVAVIFGLAVSLSRVVCCFFDDGNV